MHQTIQRGCPPRWQLLKSSRLKREERGRQPVNSVDRSGPKAEGGVKLKNQGVPRSRASPPGGGNNVKLGANVDRCAPTSWLDCFKSDNKNETISWRLRAPAESWRAAAAATTRGSERGTRAEEAVPARYAGLLRSTFAPPTPPLFLCPHQNSPRERGKTPHCVGVASIANRRGQPFARLAQVAMETDEKRRPGLFETIIRRSIPLARASSTYPLFGAAGPLRSFSPAE